MVILFFIKLYACNSMYLNILDKEIKKIRKKREQVNHVVAWLKIFNSLTVQLWVMEVWVITY